MKWYEHIAGSVPGETYIRELRFWAMVDGVLDYTGTVNVRWREIKQNIDIVTGASSGDPTRTIQRDAKELRQLFTFDSELNGRSTIAISLNSLNDRVTLGRVMNWVRFNFQPLARYAVGEIDPIEFLFQDPVTVIRRWRNLNFFAAAMFLKKRVPCSYYQYPKNGTIGLFSIDIQPLAFVYRGSSVMVLARNYSGSKLARQYDLARLSPRDEAINILNPSWPDLSTLTEGIDQPMSQSELYSMYKNTIGYWKSETKQKVTIRFTDTNTKKQLTHDLEFASDPIPILQYVLSKLGKVVVIKASPELIQLAAEYGVADNPKFFQLDT